MSGHHTALHLCTEVSIKNLSLHKCQLQTGKVVSVLTHGILKAIESAMFSSSCFQDLVGMNTSVIFHL